MGKGGNINNGYAHPFHLHGTHFYVMKLAYPPTYDEQGLLNSTSPDVPCNNITVGHSLSNIYIAKIFSKNVLA